MGHRQKQYSPRWDAAEHGVPFGAILFAYRNFIEKWNKILKSRLRPLKQEIGLVKLIIMGESIRKIWVNIFKKRIICVICGLV